MRRLLSLLVLIACSQSIEAQDQRFHFGLKIIPSMAWIKPDAKGLERDGSTIGFGYGVQTEFKLQENYAISTGVQVNYRGGALRHSFKGMQNNDTSMTVDYRLQYIEIPVTLKMMTNEFRKIKYYGQFGFSPGIAIRSKTDPGISTDDDDFSDYTNRINMNMIIGAGIHYTLSGTTVLFAGVEFNNGFINVFDKDSKELQWSGEGKIKGVTNYLGLCTGVLF